MEAEFNEDKLHQKLVVLPFWKQLAFLLIVCQRLIPSFRAFAGKPRGKKDESLLNDILNKAWSTLLSGVTKADFSNEVVQAESVAPETEDSELLYVSSVLDASVAIGLLMKSFSDGQTDTIIEGVTLIRDSVDMYVQELENMVPNDPELEIKVLNHELMQQELKRQREDIEFLSVLNEDIGLAMTIVKEKWFDKEESCLGLMR